MLFHGSSKIKVYLTEIIKVLSWESNPGTRTWRVLTFPGLTDVDDFQLHTAIKLGFTGITSQKSWKKNIQLSGCFWKSMEICSNAPPSLGPRPSPAGVSQAAVLATPRSNERQAKWDKAGEWGVSFHVPGVWIMRFDLQRTTNSHHARLCIWRMTNVHREAQHSWKDLPNSILQEWMASAPFGSPSQPPKLPPNLASDNSWSPLLSGNMPETSWDHCFVTWLERRRFLVLSLRKAWSKTLESKKISTDRRIHRKDFRTYRDLVPRWHAFLGAN